MARKARKAETAAGSAAKTVQDGVRPRRGKPIWRHVLAVLVGLWLTLEVYGPALHGPFLFDDLYLPFMRPGLAEAPLRHWLGQIRPVLMLSYWINYRLSGQDPYCYHLFNVAAHFLAGLLVFLVIRKLLTCAAVEGARRDVLASFAAGVFLLHPLQTESVSYVASRSEVLSGLFFYAALALFLYRRRAEVSWPVSLGVLLLYGAAVLSKEHTAVLVALLLLTDYFWNPGFRFEGIRRNWRLYAPIALGGAAALKFVWGVLASSDSAGFGIREFTWQQYFFTQCRALWLYLRLFLLPYGQNLDHDFPISRSLLDHGALLAMAALSAAVAAALIWRQRYPLAAYGWLAALVTLAPTSSVVPILDPVAERRVYLALPWLALIAVELLRRWRTSTRRLAAVLCVIVAVAAAFSWRRNQVWSGAVALWQDSVAKSPNKQRPHFQLAYAYYQEGRCREALAEYAQAARTGRADYRLLVDWALAYDCAGQLEAAIEKLRAAAELENTAHVHALIGMVYAKSGRRAEALAELDIAERLQPRFEMTYVYRGNVYLSAGELPAAARQYRRALDINPRNEAALHGLRQAESAGPAGP